MAGQLMLPGVALAAEMPEPAVGQDVAAASVADPVEPVVAGQAAETPATTVGAPSLTAMDAEPAVTPAVAPVAALDAAEPEVAGASADESAGAPAPTPESVATASAPAAALTRGVTNPGGGEIKINTTVVNHYYDLELPPAFTLIQDEAYVYDFPDAPGDFTLWRNESVHFFKIDPDTESLIKTENPNEANVSIRLASVENHERATLVFTGGDADPLISYSLDLSHWIYISALADFDFSNFNNGEGTILETKHMYYIRCAFDSNVYLIATDTTDPEPDPGVKPDPDVKSDPETKAESALQSKAENPAAYPASTKATTGAEPAETALSATGDSGAMAVALGAAVAAAAGVVAARRRSR